VSEIDTSLLLAQELVHFGFINEVVTWHFIQCSLVQYSFC
jgi:hypothetical protein